MSGAEAMYARLSKADIEGLSLPECFRQGRFDGDGEIECIGGRAHGFLKDRDDHCRIEFLCDMMAALILMPSRRFALVSHLTDIRLAILFDVEPTLVRFRRAL